MNPLTVTAERHFPRAEGDEITVSERPQGRVSRQLFLGESLDADHISANYDQGVLTLHIPVAEKAKPRKVAVSSGDTPAPPGLAGAPEAVEGHHSCLCSRISHSANSTPPGSPSTGPGALRARGGKTWRIAG